MQAIKVCKGTVLSTLAVLEFTTSLYSSVLTFDEVSPVEYATIENGYGGLQWTNFFVQNGLASAGHLNGIVSSPNVAFNGFGNAAAIGKGSPFTFGSAYLTAVGVNGTQVRVQGFTGATQTYDNTYAVNGHGPNLIHFNYVGVDQVRFTASPFGLFAMDNLSLAVSDTNTLCTFALPSANDRHGPGVGTGTVTVFAQSDCEWNVINTNSWIFISSSLTNTNSGIVTYAVATNATGVPRNGYLSIAGESFVVIQYGAPGTNSVNLGEVRTQTIGHRFFTPASQGSPRRVMDYLVDQDQNSGGGGVLPSFAANFDTANQFVLRISAPPGKRFLIQPPAGQAVRFGSGLNWQGPNVLSNGPSHFGTLNVSFSNLQGTPPDFSASRTVLSEYHGVVGFNDIQSAVFTNELSFTSMTLTATVPSANVGSGTINYNPQSSALLLRYDTPLTVDPGAFVFIVPALPPVLNMVLQFDGSVLVTFTGILQYASEADGVFEDVPGSPQGIYIVSKANLTGRQYFRARSN